MLLTSAFRRSVVPAWVPVYVGGLNAWSNPATWGEDGPPQDGESFTLGVGETLVIDCETADIDVFEVRGDVIVDPMRGGKLNVRRLWVPGGSFTGGTLAAPIQADFDIEQWGEEVRPDGQLSSVAGRFPRVVIDITSSVSGKGWPRQFAPTLTARTGHDYNIVFTSATAFNVVRNGVTLGSGTASPSGDWYVGEIRFRMTTGDAPFVAGDTFSFKTEQLGFINNGIARSIEVDGGVFKLYGRAKDRKGKLGDHMLDGAGNFVLEESTNWQAGDRIFIGPTQFHDFAAGVPIQRWVASRDGTAVTCTGGKAGSGKRWGKLQYMVDESVEHPLGLSLTPGTLTNITHTGGTIPAEAWDEIPKTLDERARIINVSSNVRIYGRNDAEARVRKFGGHIMVMDRESTFILDNVELTRMGQAGAFARYPVHFHMLSWLQPQGAALPTDGTYLGLVDPTRFRITNCGFHDCFQRMIVVHGTDGAVVTGNVGAFITGHALFLEDNAERKNVIHHNVVMGVTAPTEANKLLHSDVPGSVETFGNNPGSAGGWFPNPDNDIQFNEFYACPTPFWNGFAATKSLGLCRETGVVPNDLDVLAHSDNVAACGHIVGGITDRPPRDNFHNVDTAIYERYGFHFERNVFWKNRGAGYRNRVAATANPSLGGYPPGQPDELRDAEYRGGISADNEGFDFIGQSRYIFLLHRWQHVGVSLNSEEEAVTGDYIGETCEERADRTGRAAFATYDEALVHRNAIVRNFPLRIPVGSMSSHGNVAPGWHGGGLTPLGEYIFPKYRHDYYGGWNMAASSPGWFIPALQADDPDGSKVNLGVFEDASGFHGTAGRSYVTNLPFFTNGAADLQLHQSAWGGVPERAIYSTSSKYVGVNPTILTGIARHPGGDPVTTWPLTYDKLDSSLNIIAALKYADARADGAFGLKHFRGTGLIHGGIYRIRVSTSAAPATETITGPISLELKLPEDTSFYCTLILPYPSGLSLSAVTVKNEEGAEAASAGDVSDGYARNLNNTGMSTWADVHADTTGLKYIRMGDWVVVRLRGGVLTKPFRKDPSAGKYTGSSVTGYEDPHTSLYLNVG